MLEAPFCDSITLLNPTEHSIQYNAADIMLRIFRQYYPIRNVIFAVGEGFVIYAAVAIACWIKLGADLAVFDRQIVLVDVEGDEVRRAKERQPALAAVVADGRSDPATFGREAARLTGPEGIGNVFGCWTSSARKAVRREVESAGALLWYPVQYEGLEESENVFYTGATINQQVEPALDWALTELGRRFFLVGSDYVYPRTANRLAKAIVRSHGGTVVGEALVPLGSVEFSDVVQRLRDAGPLVVFSTVNGDSNNAFYRQLAAAGLGPSEYPVIAMSVAETELLSLGKPAHGHLACWGYFQSLKTESNRKFIAAYRARFGHECSTSDPIATAHTQVLLWAAAVRKAGSFEPAAVAKAAIHSPKRSRPRAIATSAVSTGARANRPMRPTMPPRNTEPGAGVSE